MNLSPNLARKGLLPSAMSRSAHRLAASMHPQIRTRLALGLNGGATLPTCAVLDQGNSGTCHAHSAAAAIWSAYAAKGKPLPWVPSPRLIASTTYADVQGPAGKRGPLQDTGAELQDDATALRTWGIGPMQGRASDGRNSDVESDPPDGTFPEPEIAQIAIAGADLVAGEYAITTGTVSTAQTIAASLDAGVPVWIGFFCDSAFEQLGPNDVAGAPNELDPNGGGHAVVLVGYRTSGSALEFRLQNSWSATWCDAGFCWVSEAFVAALWAAWPMAVAT